MQHAKMRFRMVFGKMRKGTRDGFRSDQAEVVQIVGSGRVRVIGIEDAARERGAILRNAVKVVLIGERVEFLDQRAVLFYGGLDDKNIDTALKRGADHLAPLGFATRAATGA